MDEGKVAGSRTSQSRLRVVTGMRTCLTITLAAVCLCAITASSASAGGDPPSLAACGQTLWITSEAGVIEADAATGRTLRHLQASRPYATGVVCDAGHAYVTSVENGYIAGSVDRFDTSSGRRTRIQSRGGGIFDIALAFGRVFVIEGSRHLHVVELAHGTAPEVVLADRRPAWVVGGSALTIVGDDGLLRQRSRAGRDRVLASGIGWPAVPCAPGVLVAAPGRLRLIAAMPSAWSVPVRPVALACHGATAWVATSDAAGPGTVVRRRRMVDGSSLRRVRIKGSAVALAVAPQVVWVATVGQAQRLVGLDPQTLRVISARTIL